MAFQNHGQTHNFLNTYQLADIYTNKFNTNLKQVVFVHTSHFMLNIRFVRPCFLNSFYKYSIFSSKSLNICEETECEGNEYTNQCTCISLIFHKLWTEVCWKVRNEFYIDENGISIWSCCLHIAPPCSMALLSFIFFFNLALSVIRLNYFLLNRSTPSKLLHIIFRAFWIEVLDWIYTSMCISMCDLIQKSD